MDFLTIMVNQSGFGYYVVGLALQHGFLYSEVDVSATVASISGGAKMGSGSSQDGLLPMAR